MSSIWNPQDRFILSNMTSEKLYAKSPLTTGVSGTSAYIGLEPSATYNETVLYSGNTAVTAFTASEPLTNFEEVAFYVAPNFETMVTKVVLPMVGYNTSHLALTYHSTWNGFKGGIQISTEYNNTGMSAFQLISGAWFGWANDAAKTGTYNDAFIHKIVGVNRKEV